MIRSMSRHPRHAQRRLARGREAEQPLAGRWVGNAQAKVNARFGHRRQRAGDDHDLTCLAGEIDCLRDRRYLLNVLTERDERLRQEIGRHLPR